MKPRKIGNATLYLGDAAEVIPELSGVELVVTDPPYSSGARRDSERQVRGAMLRSMKDADWFSHDAMTSWGFGWFIRSLFTQLRPRLPVGAHLYIFTDWRMTPTIYGMMEASGYRVNHCLVWAKPHFGMGSYWRNQHENIVFASNGTPAEMLNRGAGTVLNYAAVSPKARIHATEKPTDLLHHIIDVAPGSIVFDPYMGSGSCAVAALKAGRKFIGCEINPDIFEIACHRIKEAIK